MVMAITMLVRFVSAPNVISAKQAPTASSNSANLRHVPVPSPTSFLNQLLSSDAQVRIKALQLVGVSDLFLQQKTFNGENWTIVSQARLLYGHYMEDRDLAVIVLQMQDYAWASVLLRNSSGWLRIGVFNCWCKYESNPLEGFIELRPVLQWPQTEILVHESGGGSGLYDRFFRIFRLQNSKLTKIYETSDKKDDCHPTQNKDYCTLTEARIETGNVLGSPTIVVARLESLEPIPSIPQAGLRFGDAPKLEVYKNVRRTGCEVLIWDTAKTSFIKSKQWTQLYCVDGLVHTSKQPGN